MSGREGMETAMNHDQLMIIETCTRMAWHADRREWDLVAGVFADRVVLDYTSLNGGEPVQPSSPRSAETTTTAVVIMARRFRAASAGSRWTPWL